MPRIIQLTDSHITAKGTLWKGQVDTAARFAEQIDGLAALAPDLVIHTGDVVEMGPFDEGPAEYAQAAKLLDRIDAPLRILPGNHDGRAAMRAAFPGHQWDGAPFLNFSMDLDGLHVIGLDSIIEGQTGGALPPAQADWLARHLDDRPTIIFLHHPPCPMGLPFMDGFGFEGTEAFADLVRGRNVLRLACGHVHVDNAVHWAGTIVASAEASAVHIHPDMPAFQQMPKGQDRTAGLEPQRLRIFDWEDGTLSVKTLPAHPSPDRAVI